MGLPLRTKIKFGYEREKTIVLGHHREFSKNVFSEKKPFFVYTFTKISTLPLDSGHKVKFLLLTYPISN